MKRRRVWSSMHLDSAETAELSQPALEALNVPPATSASIVPIRSKGLRAAPPTASASSSTRNATPKSDVSGSATGNDAWAASSQTSKRYAELSNDSTAPYKQASNVRE